MRKSLYLFDTHALIFWQSKTSVSSEFLHFFDQQAQEGNLFVSSISFWEIAFLVQKKRVEIDDLQKWKDSLLEHSGIRMLYATADEMIASTQLPTHHQDPFDRLLIVQANQNGMILVTRDEIIQQYDIRHYWLE